MYCSSVPIGRVDSIFCYGMPNQPWMSSRIIGISHNHSEIQESRLIFERIGAKRVIFQENEASQNNKIFNI